MDISSTTSSSMATADTSAQSLPAKSSTGDSSFKDEMSKVSTTKKEEQSDNEVKSEATLDKATEKQEISVDNKQNSTDKAQNHVNNQHNNDLNQALVLSGNIAVQNPLTNSAEDSVQVLLDANRQLSHITTMRNELKMPAAVDYSSVQMDMDDAKFFADLVQNPEQTLQTVATEIKQGAEMEVQNLQKSVKVSATLMNALSEAVKNNQSVRIDFDKDISVIIRVDKDGSISAKFIPGDSAVEQYLKQNIGFLRQRFDEQELSYTDLSYSRQKQNQQQNKRNNKENNHE